MVSILRYGVVMFAGCFITGCAASQQPTGRTDYPAVAESELVVLASAFKRGDLGLGNCPWLHPVSGNPTTVPCDLVPLDILISMAENSANKHAQLELGKRYEEGRGVAADRNKARKLYRLAGRDSVRGRPIPMPGRNLSPLAFGEEGHGGTVIAAGLSRPRVPGWIHPPGLEEARQRLRDLEK